MPQNNNDPVELSRQLVAVREAQIKDARKMASDLRNLLALTAGTLGNWESYDEETKAKVREQFARITPDFLTLPWEEEGSWNPDIPTILASLNSED